MASYLTPSAGIAGAPIALRVDAPFDLWIDDGARIVRTAGRGFWTMAQAEAYAFELGEVMDQCRLRFGHSRVLSDRRGTPVQAHAVADRLGLANATLFTERDRLAVVVDSSLAKSQLRRRFAHSGSQAFLSYAAAELWLTAWP